jgi:hypothetical protein
MRDERWLDEEAGPVVRPYAMTGGRVQSAAGELDLLAHVTAVRRDGPEPAGLGPEHRALLAAADEPVSVVEAAARLDLGVPVIRVLLGDLLAAGLVNLHQPPGLNHMPDEDVLKAVVNGLRAQ